MIDTLFPVLKTIKVGTGSKTADEIRTALTDAGCKINDWANDILGKPAFTVASQEADVDLIALTTAQLTDKKEGGTTMEVFAGAARFGLDKCAPDDGPQFRRQYLDQPLGERLWMGMEPIRISYGFLSVFLVARNVAGLWLSADCAVPGSHWNGDDLWVFRRRK